MNIGNVIKKYRKELGYTQEEMANRLGVTTPAVNKWENGNSNPDIELLAPIARLLHISLDTLLSFRENLTDIEIEELIHKMDKMFSEEGFEKTYQWAVNTIKEYPNCNLLIWQIAVMLDSRRIIGMCENPDRYDEQINSWYEMALSDKDEKIQHYAADSLFGFYLRKKNYEMAEKYLNYFSDYDPMKKVKQGQLYMKQGKKEEAFEMLEKAVFSEYTTLNLAFGIMITKALEEKDHGYARFLAEKMSTLASGFDMGKYNECAAMLNVVTAENNVEGTFQVAKQLLNNVDTICDFQESQLYKHMKFQEVENPVVAADALRFVDHRSGAIEFDGCRHDDQQRREQEDRRERCRDVEGPFPERHAENLHFGAVLRDGLVREGVVAHELQHAQEILPRHVSRNGAVHPCAQVFAAFPFGQLPRGDEHDAPARPRIEEPDVGEVGGRVALFVEDERMIRPERRQRAHRRADVPHDVHPAFDHFREAGRVAAFAFDVDDGVFQSRIFLMRILSSCGLNGLTM